MYKYESALCLERIINAQWKSVDLETIPVQEIFDTYAKVYVTVSTIYLDQPVHVDLAVLHVEYSDFPGTLDELFETLGNRALPTIPELPISPVKYVKYSDVFRANYKVEVVKAGFELPSDYPKSELVDLKLSRPGYQTDMRLLHSHCLVSVNGYFHRTDTDGEFAYVYEGGRSLMKSKHNQLGIHSFLQVGEIKQVPLLPENIYGQNNTGDLKTRTYFQIDEDLTNKSVFLVLGGYLVFQHEGVFWQSGDNIFALNFTAMPIVERLMESMQYLDLSSLGLSVSTENKDMINVSEFLSDEVLIKYLTLSQSFVVIVDTPMLFTNRLYLRNCNLPGMFTAYQDPTYPLVVNYGKVAEYWKTHEDGQWSVTVQDSFLRNFVFTHKPVFQLKNVTPNAVPSQTFFHSQAYLLQIGTYR